MPAFSGNRVFRAIIEQIVTPWLQDFQAEMLFISAGFDAHFSDPLTTLTLDTKGFYKLAQALIKLADQYCHGRVMFVLEGGYDPRALRDNIQACLAALCDQKNYPDHYGKASDYEPNVSELIEQLKKIHHL